MPYGEGATYRIERLGAVGAEAYFDRLVDLLQDVVDGGASVGFLPPLAALDARVYWGAVVAAVSEGTRVLLAALDRDDVLGSVQLDVATMPNARHRAEVMKLLVRRRARRQGIGRALMQAVEDVARDAGRSLLVLDTRSGDAAEALYDRLGYTRVGVIPRYARSASGTLEDTVYFYREL